MSITEQLDQEDFEKAQNDLFAQKHPLATKHGFTFSKFKELLGPYLDRKNTEDQWVFDYESYVIQLNQYFFQDPASWALEYYDGAFDYEKYLANEINKFSTKK